MKASVLRAAIKKANPEFNPAQARDELIEVKVMLAFLNALTNCNEITDDDLSYEVSNAKKELEKFLSGLKISKSSVLSALAANDNSNSESGFASFKKSVEKLTGMEMETLLPLVVGALVAAKSRRGLVGNIVTAYKPSLWTRFVRAIDNF